MYDYPKISRDQSTGIRLYKTPKEDLVPSVTTILSKTKDMSGLQKWENRVGKERAERIRNEAASTGTSMHKFLECHLLEEERMFVASPIHSQASQMSEVIIREGLKYVDEIWGTEVQLYYEDKYAGTTDAVGLYKDKPHIIDFKQLKGKNEIS